VLVQCAGYIFVELSEIDHSLLCPTVRHQLLEELLLGRGWLWLTPRGTRTKVQAIERPHLLLGSGFR
jgi:hypothetical protein